MFLLILHLALLYSSKLEIVLYTLFVLFCLWSVFSLSLPSLHKPKWRVVYEVQSSEVYEVPVYRPVISGDIYRVLSTVNSNAIKGRRH